MKKLIPKFFKSSAGCFKANWKKIVTTTVALAFVCVFCGCSGVGSNDGIKANTWYTYDALDILHIQNCVVSNATTIGNSGVMVTYYPVCKECREPGALSMAGPEYNYPVSKSYYCENCDVTTIVKLKIDY